MRRRITFAFPVVGIFERLLLLVLVDLFLGWKFFQQNDGVRDRRVVGSDAFRGFSFDTNTVRRNAQKFRHIGSDCIRMGPDFGGIHDQGGIDIGDGVPSRCHAFLSLVQEKG